MSVSELGQALKEVVTGDVHALIEVEAMSAMPLHAGIEID